MQGRRLVVVFLVLAGLVFGRPVSGAADLMERSQAIGQEKALQQQEKSAALTLLSLDEEIAAREAAADRIKAALPAAGGAVAEATRAMAAAGREMAADRQKLGQWLNFLYRYGDVSFLAVVLQAKSFDDFESRLVFVTTLLENQAGLWRKAGVQEAVYTRTVADLQDKEKALQQEKAGLDATVAALQGEQRDKTAFVASLRRQSASLARQVATEEAGWVASLQPLTRVLHDLSGLPWDGMTPDSVNFGFGGVTLEFDDATLSQVLDSDPVAAGVDLRLAADSSGVTISGDQNGVSFALQASLTVAGPRTVRLVPGELDLAGLPVQDATLQAVTGGDPTFDLPGADPQWKLSAIDTGPHYVDFVFGQ